ncbi:MAG: GGDEF domain-containing protein [Syntrophaceae bacterium]|nr:GGDEF domain-containing protein [Syntrophaceae bacterium]
MQTLDFFCERILDNMSDGIYFLDTNRTITYWNRGAERITGYLASDVLGSGCRDNILVHVDGDGTPLCQGGCPVLQTLTDAESREADVFLHHREGHRVPVNVHVSPIPDHTGRPVGVVEIFREITSDMAVMQYIEDLKKAALLDPLTGLVNRRFLDMKIRSCFEDLHRHGFPFALVFADIDHFKNVNDTHGHMIGDEVLKMVSRTLKENIRSSDTTGRWGGEEFLLILQHLDERELEPTANKLRVLVETSFLRVGNCNLLVTVSMGASMARRNDSAESLITRVDELLYRAKAEGRNRAITAG